jgi:hypothetical protein
MASRRYFVAVKARRQSFWARRRGMCPCDSFMLLELQRSLHDSVDCADVILDFLEMHTRNRPDWDPRLEPLLEELRRVHTSTRLTRLFLRAGVTGASYRWLETTCQVSRLNRDASLQHWWDLYLARARAEDELIWFCDFQM